MAELTTVLQKIDEESGVAWLTFNRPEKKNAMSQKFMAELIAALKNLAERTGLNDIRALVNMMIQTDRFGTSVADALRVHSDTMRTKRRQRAEEAAAKTTIKLVFPLVLFVFPAMFVVVIGPSALAIYRTFSKL